MKKFVVPILAFLGFIGFLGGVFWCVAVVFYYTAATYVSTPTPSLVSNEVNLQPLLGVNFVLSQESFEESIDLGLLKNTPQVSFPSAFQTIPLNDLYYSYQATNPAGLRTNVNVFVIYTPSTPISNMSLNCPLPTKVYRTEQSEDKDNPYTFCISYLDQPNELFSQADYYTSFIDIQKNGLSIRISEWTETTERKVMNEVIKQLAEVLQPSSP